MHSIYRAKPAMLPNIVRHKVDTTDQVNVPNASMCARISDRTFQRVIKRVDFCGMLWGAKIIQQQHCHAEQTRSMFGIFDIFAQTQRTSHADLIWGKICKSLVRLRMCIWCGWQSVWFEANLKPSMHIRPRIYLEVHRSDLCDNFCNFLIDGNKIDSIKNFNQ